MTIPNVVEQRTESEAFRLSGYYLFHRPRFPLPLPPPRPPPLPPFAAKFFRGPSISEISFLLSVKVPPENFPTPGAPTPLSLLPSLLFFICAFSRIIPFSLASLFLLSSFSPFFAIIPFQCDIGIFSCFRIDVLDPNACNRRSVALCRLLPLRVGLFAESRRWDSARSRWSARSFFRFAASEASSSSTDMPALSRSTETAGADLGSFEL